MDTVAVVSNPPFEQHAIQRGLFIAASIVPTFLACLSTVSCQQRHYIESHWGGLIILCGFLIYEFGKLPRASANSTEIANRLSNRPAAIRSTELTFDRCF